MNVFKRNRADGVMLRHSKHGGNGLYARILRVPQDDSALLLTRTVIARNEAIPELCQSRSMNIIWRYLPGVLIAVFCLFLSLTAWSQGKDTSAKVKSSDSVVDKDAVYVIDGEISKNKLNGINPNDILEIKVLKYTSADPSMANPSDKGAVLVVTKKGAVQSYQKKFSALSKNYRSYMKRYRDTDMYYVINGKQVTGSTDEIIRSLYELPADKIKYVDVIDYHKDTAVLKSVVVITTKK